MTDDAETNESNFKRYDGLSEDYLSDEDVEEDINASAAHLETQAHMTLSERCIY